MIDFTLVKEQGKRFVSQHLILLRHGTKEPRLGVIVTKKTGGSVIRNRWKRILRETFRTEKDVNQLTGDHLVIVKNSQKGRPPKSLRDEWTRLVQKAQYR